jgi:hypothetical protein
VLPFPEHGENLVGVGLAGQVAGPGVQLKRAMVLGERVLVAPDPSRPRPAGRPESRRQAPR